MVRSVRLPLSIRPIPIIRRHLYYKCLATTICSAIANSGLIYGLTGGRARLVDHSLLRRHRSVIDNETLVPEEQNPTSVQSITV